MGKGQSNVPEDNMPRWDMVTTGVSSKFSSMTCTGGV